MEYSLQITESIGAQYSLGMWLIGPTVRLAPGSRLHQEIVIGQSNRIAARHGQICGHRHDGERPNKKYNGVTIR